MFASLFRQLYFRFARLNPYFNRLRYEFFRWKFHQAGVKGSLAQNVQILGQCKIYLGDRVTLRQSVTIGGEGELRIGDSTTINDQTIISCTLKVDIGKNCMFAPRCYVLDVDHEFSDLTTPIKDQGYRQGSVSIGDDVWLGTGVVITQGVSVGDGCIIAANSVVTHDIPAFSIAGGVPAKVIKRRE